MSLEILNTFRRQLATVNGLSEQTKKKYYHAVKKLLCSMEFESVAELKPEQLLQQLKSLKTKNDVSAAKNGLLQMKKCFPDLRLPSEKEFKNISIHKRNIKKRKFDPVKLDTIKRKINKVSNIKLRHGYNLMLDTGLRVFEVEQITKSSFRPEGEKLFIKIDHAKGNVEKVVEVTQPRLKERLLEFIKPLEENEKVFYSKTYMQNVAANYGFECHDLRRAYARVQHKAISQEIGAYAANEEVRKLLNHASMKNTKKYLRRKIIV